MAASSSSTSASTDAHASIPGPAYLSALSRFIRTHEAALAAYHAPRRPASSSLLSPGGGAPGPSWTTILSLGILPDASSPSSPSSSPRKSTRTPTPPAVQKREPLVLEFDPHHIYYLLLKFDELALPTGGELDIKVEGGYARPMSIDYTAVEGSAVIDIEHDRDRGGTPSVFAGLPGAGMLGFSSAGGRDTSDSRSVRSGKSSFSFGSGWWGLGSSSSASALPAEDEPAQVRYIYSSCTKLPALQLSPFVFSSSASTAPSSSHPPTAAVQGFEDCPPPSTCVPLSVFKNLTSLHLVDLDPRAFLGWEVLAVQLRRLEVVRGGIEDVGELICDCVVEDEERSQRRREAESGGEASGGGKGTVGEGRRRRAEGAHPSSFLEPNPQPPDARPRSPTTASYPAPPRLAWSSLRHLSLTDNSLTFLPSPPLSFLPTLTSLDLSSNLLVSVPPALSSLPHLRSLNLRDNMIDTLLGLPTILGAVEVLNLSQNRIENLSGLDRLLALERLDVRENRIYEALEVSRLAGLPRLREVWVAGNPFARKREEGGEEAWRVKCLSYFEVEREGRDDPDEREVLLDGQAMTRSGRKAVEVEVARRTGRAPRAGGGAVRKRPSESNLVAAERGASNGSGALKKVVVERRRVFTAPHYDLATPASSDSPARSHSSSPTVFSPLPAASAPSQVSNPSSSPTKVKSSQKRRKPRRIVDLDAPPVPPLSASAVAAHSDSDLTTSSGAEGGGRDTHPSRPTTLPRVEEPAAPSSSTDDALSSSPRRQPPATPPSAGASPSNAASFGRSASPSAPIRREPISSSTSEPPVAGSSAGGEAGGEFRRKIEQLRDEVGENWLSVLGEREARAEREKKLPEDELEEEGEGQGEGDRDAGGEEAAQAPTVSAGVRVVKKKGKKKKAGNGNGIGKGGG
ncbi:hypothetical protein JCM21900_004841 [Sporobolomyces salmonicolor]